LKPDDRDLVRPQYDRRCISNLPDAIRHQFGLPHRKLGLIDVLLEAGAKPGRFRNVILLLIDGAGVTQTSDWAALAGFRRAGSVTPITTVFPSTTAAALTTLHSGGLTPREHGLPEWHIYFRELDEILESLPFRRLEDGTLCNADPKMLFDGPTMYEELGKAGVQSFTFVRSAYSDGPYSRVALRGSTVVGALDTADLFVNLAARLSSTTSPTYFFVYWDAIDNMAHRYGPGGEYSKVGLDTLGFALKRGLLDHLDESVRRDTLLLLTADHGGVRVNPQETIYLEHEWPGINDAFRNGPRGRLILPSGNVRDVFLSIREDQLDLTASTLRQLLAGRADILTSEEAVRDGLFGSGEVDHPEFRSRIGDILILPRGNRTIWFRHPGTQPYHLPGTHGGLTRDEMMVPLAVSPLSGLA